MDQPHPRYAIYFAPQPRSTWWHGGCSWLGRDAASGNSCLQPEIPGVPRPLQVAMTAAPQRYGLHATLKAPFFLAEGFTENDLLAIADEFAPRQRPIVLEGMHVGLLRGFLALRLPPESLVAGEVAALAHRCVTGFDMLRAAPSAAELARRRRARLTPRQEVLLARWGYPYTEEEFCLHMTLTERLGELTPPIVLAVRQAAEAVFAAAIATETMQIDALTIFRQDRPDGQFMVWRRFAFARQ